MPLIIARIPRSICPSDRDPSMIVRYFAMFATKGIMVMVAKDGLVFKVFPVPPRLSTRGNAQASMQEDATTRTRGGSQYLSKCCNSWTFVVFSGICDFDLPCWNGVLANMSACVRSLKIRKIMRRPIKLMAVVCCARIASSVEISCREDKASSAVGITNMMKITIINDDKVVVRCRSNRSRFLS